MSPFDLLFKGVRDALLLSNEVEHLARDVKELSRDIRDHERRLVRLETLVEFSGAPVGRSGVPRLGGPE